MPAVAIAAAPLKSAVPPLYLAVSPAVMPLFFRCFLPCRESKNDTKSTH
jgi:hypothetical protein